MKGARVSGTVIYSVEDALEYVREANDKARTESNKCFAEDHSGTISRLQSKINDNAGTIRSLEGRIGLGSECFQRDHAGRIVDFEAQFKEIDEVLGRPELAEWRRIDTLKAKMKSLERLSEDVAMYEKWFEEFDKEVGIVRHDGNRMKVAVDLKKERDSLQATVDMAVQAGVLVKHEGVSVPIIEGYNVTNKKVAPGYMVLKSGPTKTLGEYTDEEIIAELKKRMG